VTALPPCLDLSCACLLLLCMQALYRGNGANVARLLPDVAFKFAVHDQFKLMFAPQDGSPPGVQEKMAAGAATGWSQQSATPPPTSASAACWAGRVLYHSCTSLL